MAFKSIFSLFSSDLAIDLGTANTLVFAKGRGIVVSEPSIVAINKITNAVEAVGRDAKEMLGRTPGNIVAIRPMKDGVIANFEVTEKMLQHFIRKAHNGKTWVSPRVVIGIPSEITQVERRAVEDSAYRAKASEVYLVEEAMAAAIGAGMPITEPQGNMVVDVGGGTTDIAVISLSGIVYSRAVRVAGNEMDEAITQFIKRRYNLLIGERTAEQIKIELGSAFELEETLTMEVRGRNLIEGIPKTIIISDAEIREALADSVATIVNAVRVALERTPPELSADIVERGIVLTGGGALLKNLDKRLSVETGLPVSLAEDPLSSVVLGTGKMLSDFNLLKRVRWDNTLTSGT
ncbi:MAG: rod shape-determining protein MreB [Acidobacteriota bacterium]|jgi:rod shape-determining protein MreB|nr:rod shape-determining protein MreB [Acidobacteriota bacterium]